MPVVVSRPPTRQAHLSRTTVALAVPVVVVVVSRPPTRRAHLSRTTLTVAMALAMPVVALAVT